MPSLMNEVSRVSLFGVFFGMFGGRDASGHGSRRPRDGARHIKVFEGGDGRGQSDVTRIRGLVRYVGRNADEIGFRNVAVIRKSW